MTRPHLRPRNSLLARAKEGDGRVPSLLHVEQSVEESGVAEKSPAAAILFWLTVISDRRRVGVTVHGANC